MDAMRQTPKLVTVIGGTGFLGRHVVSALAKRGYRLRVAARRPNLGFFLQPLGVVGQIELVQANLRYPDSVASAVRGADAVVNCVGILGETGPQSFDAVQGRGAHLVAEASASDIPFVHVSAIGADLRSPAEYGRSKARGEAAIQSRRAEAVIMRPSILFGRGDSFFNRFASLARALPVLPIAGAETRFQPAFVGDVAEAVARAVDGEVKGGVYELGGPETRTLKELVEYVLKVTERRRVVVSLPPPAGRLQARIMEIADALTLGLLPAELKLTRDQVAMLERDNVVSAEAEAAGRTFAGLGMTPRSLEAIVPEYLVRFRKTGQFDLERAV